MSSKKKMTKRSASKKRSNYWDPVPCPEGLPCPFCGSTPTIQPWHGGGPQKRMIDCANEGCHVSPSVCASTKRLAVARWNTRAPAAGGAG